MKAALSESLPFWEFRTEPFAHVLLSDGALSAGLEVVPLDIECFDEARINHFTASMRAFINSLPEGLTCQFMVKVESDVAATVDRHAGLINTSNEFLKSLDLERTQILSSEAESGNLFRPRLMVFFKTEQSEKPSFFSLSRIKRFSETFENDFDEKIQLLGQTLSGAETSLSSVGFSARTLQCKEIVELIYGHLNPKRDSEVAPPSLKICDGDVDPESPRSQLVFGDLVLDREDFVLDRLRTRVLTLKTLPELTFAGMMSGFLAFPFKFELLVTFHIPDQAKEVRSLEQKRRMAHSLSTSASNRVTDLESESRLSQTTDLLRELIATGQKIFQAELVVIIRDDADLPGTRRLNLKTKEVLAKFKTLSGAEGVQETVASWKVFKSDLPLAPSQLVRAKRMKTNNLVDFLPVYGASTGDESPHCLLRTRLGTLFSLNPYSSRLNNYNMLVTGSSGSGKSFANNFLMLQQIARGTKVFVVDVGGSYRKMTEILGGQYFDVNLSGQYAINPFDMRNPKCAPSGERLKALVSVVEQMVVDEGEKLSRFERVELERALETVFAECRRKFEPVSPTLSDLANYCLTYGDEGLQRIGKLLHPWTGDTPYGRLLDRPGTIEANRSIVTFDLKGLSQYPDLQSVMILIVTGFILEQVETDRTTFKRVLLDEAWELLKSPAASRFMEYAVRTFRKTGSGITFITQGVEEIIASGLGSAILNNTAMKLVMLQRGNTDVLRDALKLNSQELRLIQSLEQEKGSYSEGFLMVGDVRQVIRIQPPPRQYWISTSDPRDDAYIQRLQSKGYSLEEAIAEAAISAPFGVSSSMRVAA